MSCLSMLEKEAPVVNGTKNGENEYLISNKYYIPLYIC